MIGSVDVAPVIDGGVDLSLACGRGEILSWMGCNGDECACVVASHSGGFEMPVVFVVLDDADRVDPDGGDVELYADVDCFSKSFGHVRITDSLSPNLDVGIFRVADCGLRCFPYMAQGGVPSPFACFVVAKLKGGISAGRGRDGEVTGWKNTVTIGWAALVVCHPAIKPHTHLCPARISK